MITVIDDPKLLSQFPPATLHWMEKEQVKICFFGDEPWNEVCRPRVGYGYVQGNEKLLNEVSLAVVGTRRASRDGLSAAFSFSRDLADCGLHIVSGLALGVDSFAHRGALASGRGKTIAILGSGLGRIYPRENRALAQAIVESGGCLVSEYHPDVGPRRHHFPLRNRIVAALSRGVFVVEAPLKSGALITARLALDLGRDVYALSGHYNDAGFRGNHHLIQQGAKLITEPQNIFEEMARLLPSLLPSVEARPASPIDIISLSEWRSGYAGEFKELLSLIQLKCEQGLVFEIAPQIYLRQGAKEFTLS